MSPNILNHSLEKILEKYSQSFIVKIFEEESSGEDDLMLVFGLTQVIKAQNKQYWGRELGMCWQLLLTTLCQQTCTNFSGPIRESADEICDLVVGADAIDTKYRIGSGDAGTLKKFKQYARRLKQMGFRPILLILRNDNLPAAITACRTGGWEIKSDQDAFKYISDLTGFNLQSWLRERKNLYAVDR